MVLRLASTAAQHQSPQLQPKQPSLHWCHFVAGLIAIVAGILILFKAESIAGSSARCTAASWLLCLMEMSASDVWLDVMGGVGESTFLSSLPAQAYGACYGKTCFSAVRALLFQEQRRRAAKTVFVLKYFSNFPLKYLHILTMEACLVMLLLLVYRMQAVDWGLRLLRLSLLLSLFGCFYNTFIFYHSAHLVRGLPWHFGWGRVLNHCTTRQECFMAWKMVESGVKSCSGWRFLGKRGKLPLE